MKRKNKFIFSLVIALLLSLTLGIGALANEVNGAEGVASEALGGAETVGDGEQSVNFSDNAEVGADVSVPEENYEDKNIFEIAYVALSSHADDIFSVLAFIGTLIITVCYKRGMLPLLSGALSKLGDAVGALREGSTECLEKTGQEISAIAEKLACVENSLELFSKEIIDLEERLGTQSELRADRENYRKILLAEIDMLKDIFTSSALPQYQKDAVNEKVKKMKEELISNGENEE